MTISESPASVRLTEEIADLRAALDGTPAVLREQGLFAAYESRLALLQEELISLRLAPLVSKYQRQLKVKGSGTLAEGPAGAVSEAGRISLATEAIESLRLEQHRMITYYRYVLFSLGAAIVAGGISLFAVNTSSFPLVIEHIDAIENIGRVLTPLLAIGLLWVWGLEKTKTDADHHLELLRTQLEFLSSFYNSKQAPLPQVYDRTLKLLDEARIV